MFVVPGFQSKGSLPDRSWCVVECADCGRILYVSDGTREEVLADL